METQQLQVKIKNDTGTLKARKKQKIRLNPRNPVRTQTGKHDVPAKRKGIFHSTQHRG